MTWEIFFFRNHADNKAGELVPDHLLFFVKALWGKRKYLLCTNIYFDSSSLAHTIKTYCMKWARP